MIFYCVNIFVQFYSRKIFLNYLGTEILGLNTTAVNILQFLNLAELGISTAVSFTLYKPLYENNTDQINEIVGFQGGLYRRIGLLIIAGAIVIMAFFPLIFQKIELPLWYAYASFGVLLFSALLGYFANYRQILLSASQQDYKIIYSYKSVSIIKVAVQMWGVACLPHPYVWWLIFEGSFAILSSLSLEWMVKRSFPFLKTIEIPFKELKVKYNDFFIKIKQLFFHKIGLFALTQSSPIIIYAYTSLTVVTLYGNYLIIVSGLQMLFWALFNSIGAGIGNLVAEGDKRKIINVFEELFSIRFYLIAIVIFCFTCLSGDFVKLWLGDEYVLSNTTVILIAANLYIQLSRCTIENFINAYGLYYDIWAPVVEAVLNIGLSILMGYYWGLNGVLAGVLISVIIIVFCWKPYFLFTNEFKGYLKTYVVFYLKHIIAAVVAFLTVSWIVNRVHITDIANYFYFIEVLLIYIVLSAICLCATMFLTQTGLLRSMRRLTVFFKR